MSTYFLTQEEKKKIIELYASGKTQKDISIICGRGQRSIYKVLSAANIPIRIGGKVTYKDVNFDLFKKIDSEAAAYFLGLLYADGCITKSNKDGYGYEMKIALMTSDRIILEKFREILSPSAQIIRYSGKEKTGRVYDRCWFRVSRNEIAQQLISHGCIPRKTFTLEFPKTVPPHLLHHFIRGYSDGDGSITRFQRKNGKYSNCWKFISSKQFCEKAKIVLGEILNINCYQELSCPKSNQNTTTLSVNGNKQVRKVLDYIYKDATIFLPRKAQRYIDYFNITNSNLKF